MLGRDITLQHRDYDTPAHPVSSGAVFAEDMGDAMTELGHYYANADIALKRLAASDSRATSVAVWPRPDGASLPDLPSGGYWESNAFTGALLLASQITEVDGNQQCEAVQAFLRSAIDTGLALLASQKQA